MDKQTLEQRANNLIQNIGDKFAKKLAEAKTKKLLLDYDADDSVTSFTEIYDKELSKPQLPKIKTLYEDLDKRIGGGFTEGDFVVVSGLTGHGKTSFLFDMTRNMPEQNVLWLPYEETSEEFARKLILWGKEPIKYYCPRSMKSESIEWIEERILESVLKFNTKVVILDNLHFITMNGVEGNKQFAITALMCKQLKKIAQKYSIVVIIIAHLRKGEGQSKIPEIESVSGSSDIIKVADKVMCVWRESEKDITNGSIKYSGDTIIDTQKVRQGNGDLGQTRLRFNKGVYDEIVKDSFNANKLKQRLPELTNKMIINY